MEREKEILRNETLLPVYFTLEDPDLLEMYEESRAVSLSLTASSALEGQSMETCGSRSMSEEPPGQNTGVGLS